MSEASLTASSDRESRRDMIRAEREGRKEGRYRKVSEDVSDEGWKLLRIGTEPRPSRARARQGSDPSRYLLDAQSGTFDENITRIYDCISHVRGRIGMSGENIVSQYQYVVASIVASILNDANIEFTNSTSSLETFR